MLRDDTQAWGTPWRHGAGGGNIFPTVFFTGIGSVYMAHHLELTAPDAKEGRL